MIGRLARAVVPAATVAAALLLFVPGGSEPFSGAKRWVLVGAAAVSLALLPWSRRRVEVLLALPVASVALSSFLGPYTDPAAAWTALGAAVLLFAWSGSGVSRRTVVPAATLAAVLVAAVALAQAAGWDPFAGLAPDAEGTRLRVYGTLGNPDFVASALTVVLVLALGEFAASSGARRRLAWALGCLILAAALAVTRSFATVVALSMGLAAALAHLSVREGRLPRFGLLGLALGILLVAAPLAGRSAVGVAEGRIYLARVAAPRALDAPLAGAGPGAVARLWPLWELDLWKARCGDESACVEAHREYRFTGRQDHVHVDWLELLVERGVPGLVSVAIVYLLALAGTTVRAGPRAAALAGALTASAARATFDFPLARPADLVLLALVVALSRTPEEP